MLIVSIMLIVCSYAHMLIMSICRSSFHSVFFRIPCWSSSHLFSPALITPRWTPQQGKIRGKQLLARLHEILNFELLTWKFKGALLGLETVFSNCKLFKNHEKCFLFLLKSSFRYQDIELFVSTFWSYVKTAWLER